MGYVPKKIKKSLNSAKAPEIPEDCCGGNCGCHDTKVAFDAYFIAVRQDVKEVVNNNEVCKDLTSWGRDTLIDELTDRLVGNYRGGK